MRKQIISADEASRNRRLRELHSKRITEVVKPKSKDQTICDMLQNDWDNRIGPNTNGMTYLEVEQFNNLYNNF